MVSTPEISTLLTVAKPWQNRGGTTPSTSISPKSPPLRGGGEAPKGTQHRYKSPWPHSGTGLTPMLPKLYRGSGFGPFAASPEPSNGAASDGTGPSGLGSEGFAAGLCRAPAKRQLGQGGDNTPPPLSFANRGRNSLARPSYAVIILLLPSQKGFSQAAHGGRQKNAPSPLQDLGGTLSCPEGSPPLQW